MSNLGASKGKSKAAKRPFMKLFTSDYRDGTAPLSFEQKGFYMQVLTLLHDGERVPADPKKLAVMMQCDPRTAARLKRDLVAAGKLYEENGELRNKRIDRDLDPTSSEDQLNFEATSGELQPDFSEKSERTFQKPESNQTEQQPHYGEGQSQSHIPYPESRTPTSVVHEAAKSRAAKIDLDDLEGKLREACNGALANPAVAQGLYDLSTPIMWLNQGCDLDLDVIPTLRGIGKREHGKGIGSWTYFTKPVTEAKKRREAGLPDVAVQAPSAGGQSAYQLARAQLLAEEAVQ